MAVNTYVLLTVEPGQTQTISARLSEIPKAYVRKVLGPYDMVVEVEADTPEDLTAILRTKIRSVPGVSSSVTCIWI